MASVDIALSTRHTAALDTFMASGMPGPSYKALIEHDSLQKSSTALARHHTRFERTFHRCLKELKTLQANRAQKEEAFEDNVHRPGLAAAVKPASNISKRTQPVSEPVSPEEDAEIEGFFLKMEKKYGGRTTDTSHPGA